MKKLHKRTHFSSFQIIIFGFMAVILAGSLLLMLPFSTRNPGEADFFDALFTATSAVCVTGLVVQDTATYWSAFGQMVILFLIQVGGMGVVTIAVVVAMVSGRKIGLMQRSTLQEAIAAPHVGGIVKLAGFIVKTTLAIELLGAFLMIPVFCREFGIGKGVWYAVFHSVSAFCNAGFDLMGVKGKFSSLTFYAAHPVINIVIMLLIVIGGIGFLTWEDVQSKRMKLGKYRMQTKVVLTMTFLLIAFPTMYFYIFEFSGFRWEERFWYSIFQAVTPRTAGFNTANLADMSEPGQVLMIILMLVGGSPGSTAGGMKTTTVAVLAATMAAVFTRRENVNFFGRRVAMEAVRNAAAILLMYLALFLAGGFAVCILEGLPMLTCLFETASAIGTVGLTLGITTELCLASRLILVTLMFCGRVGGLTLIFAATSLTNKNVSRYPQERITVG